MLQKSEVRAMLFRLVKHLERDAENLKDSVVMVAHADNPEGAEELKRQSRVSARKLS